MVLILLSKPDFLSSCFSAIRASSASNKAMKVKLKGIKISYRCGIQNILLRVDSQSKVTAVSPPGEVREHAVGLTLALTQSTQVVRLHLCKTVVIE